jgi:hypothetical protein
MTHDTPHLYRGTLIYDDDDLWAPVHQSYDSKVNRNSISRRIWVTAYQKTPAYRAYKAQYQRARRARLKAEKESK